MGVVIPDRPTVDVGPLEGKTREIAVAYNAGGFTAVLQLAERHLVWLKREYAELTDGLTLCYVRECDRDEPSSPLEVKIDYLSGEIRRWGSYRSQVEEYAANEALGWTVRPDGSVYKVLDDGSEISVATSVCFDEAPRRPCSPVVRRRVRPLARRRGAGRPRAQATRSSARSGDGPDDDAGEPPAAPPRLAPAPRAVLTFGCLTAAERGEVSS